MQKFLLLCSYFILIYSYDRTPHKSETVVERFRFGDYDFVFYSKEANWAEAFTICKATHSRLAVVNTLDRAKFLAQSLTQTKIGFEDVWIGGRFLNDRWRWAATGKAFSRQTHDFPPWLSYPTQRGKNCLSIDRINHSYPIFVEKKCSIFTGFICEESISHTLDNFPEGGNEIEIDDRHYFLYHARVTWEEALAFCKQTESRLAIIPDLDIATKLISLMKRTRPPFENMWIGARRNYLDWVWVATEEVLPNETRQNGFPPWKNDHPVDSMKGCLLLDHHPCLIPYHFHTARQHQCEEPTFIEEECYLKKDFMCEVALEENIEKQEKSNLITVDQITYIFYDEHLSWVDAMVTCESINMTLAMPETPRQWEIIVIQMGDLQRQFDHVWLGGRWLSDKWVWLNNHSIPLPNRNETYPPWCTSMNLHEKNEDCLNLDRDSHNIPVIYGFNCSIKQGFVCQLEAFDAIKTPDPSFNNDFDHSSFNLTYFEANFDCLLNGSHLAIANSIQIAQKLALLIPRDTLVWIDGKRENNVWRWTRTQEVIPDVAGEDNYPPWESFASTLGHSMCLAMKSGFREQPFFVEKPCTERLDHLCQFDHEELPEPDLTLKLNDINYYFYKKGAAWHEAMSICQSGGLFLVNVGNLALANFLLDGMADANPQWTSGREQFLGHWSWITSGLKLPEEIKRGYPPWLNNTIPNNTESTCLLLSKLSDASTFIGKNCSEKHSFVCIDTVFIYNETEINVGDVTISVQDIITSISKAKKQCLDSGKSVVNFSKLNYKELLRILRTENVKSLWVDVIYNSDGKWVYADTLEEFKTDIDFPERNNRSKDIPKNCLTLQVTPEQQLILIPSLCSDFSRIVCMAAIKNETNAPPRVESVLNDSVTIIAILENTKISDSNLVCNDLGGEIIGNSLLNKTIEYFKTLHKEFKNFWLGATLVNGTWKWHDNSPVELVGLPAAKSNSTEPEKSCLIYNKELDNLQAASCFEKFSTVCQRIVYKCDPINITYPSNSILWSPDKCTTKRVKAGTVCRAQCQQNFNLVGPELHVCTKGKWSYNQQLLCQDDKSQGITLAKMVGTRMKSEQAKSNFLFVIDNGLIEKKGQERINYEKSLLFATNLANTVLLSEKRRAGIELYTYNAKMIDSMESKNCYLKHTVDKLYKSRVTVSRNLPNYYNALKLAEQEFASRSIDTQAAFVFFFAMRPDAGPMINRTEVIKRLKEMGITIIIVTVGDEINRSQLEEMASSKYNVLQLYSFKNMKGLQEASNYLKRRSMIHGTSCPRENVGDKII